MQARSFLFGAFWLTLGVLLAGGWFPGSETVALGPRIGLAAASLLIAALVIGFPLAGWYVKKFTKPEDYEGGCPVGSVCPSCETFNFNPRKTCKECGDSLIPATK